MKPRIARALVRLYPKGWRKRFGDELQDLLEAEQVGVRVVIDVLGAAAGEQLIAITRKRTLVMAGYPASVLDLARRPSGFIPIAMSLGALAVVVLAILTGQARRQADEGAAAHIWQLLIAGQAPILLFFLVRGFQKDARATLTVLALQAVAIGLALFPVWRLGL
jgi:hypothetical protein